MDYLIGVTGLLAIFILCMYKSFKKAMNEIVNQKERADKDVKFWSELFNTMKVKVTFERLSRLLVNQDPKAYYDVLLSIERNKSYQSTPEMNQQIDDIVNHYTATNIMDFYSWDEYPDDISLTTLLVQLWRLGQTLQPETSNLFLHTKDEGHEFYIDPAWIEQCNRLGFKPLKDTRHLSTFFFYKTLCKSHIISLIEQILNIDKVIYQMTLQDKSLPQQSPPFTNGSFKIVTNEIGFSGRTVTYQVSLHNTSTFHIRNFLITYIEIYDETNGHYKYSTNLYALIDDTKQLIDLTYMQLDFAITQQTLEQFNQTAMAVTRVGYTG